MNGHIILQSDWDYALRCQAFEDGRALDQLPPSEHKAALDRLIDQELLREQIHSAAFQHASEQEVAQRIEDIRHEYPEAATPQGWQALLSRNGLTERSSKYTSRSISFDAPGGCPLAPPERQRRFQKY